MLKNVPKSSYQRRKEYLIRVRADPAKLKKFNDSKKIVDTRSRNKKKSVTLNRSLEEISRDPKVMSDPDLVANGLVPLINRVIVNRFYDNVDKKYTYHLGEIVSYVHGMEKYRVCYLDGDHQLISFDRIYKMVLKDSSYIPKDFMKTIEENMVNGIYKKRLGLSPM